jgi:hypothetical protein
MVHHKIGPAIVPGFVLVEWQTNPQNLFHAVIFLLAAAKAYAKIA